GANPTSGSYITFFSVSLTCNDAGGAGCDKIAYSNQTGSAPTDPAITGTTGTITSGTLYSSAIAPADLATTYINFIARDQAGNTSAVSSENYIIDTTIATPSQVSALGTGTEIFVQWAPVSNATEYRIYYSTSSPVTTSSTSITGISNLYYKITGLTSDTLYYVRVEARNGAVGGGVSLLSGEQTVFTTSVPVGTAISGGHIDISAGEGTNSGINPRAVIDTAAGKLLVVTNNGANNGKPSLFRCNLDGSGCTHTDLSAGQGTDSGFELSVLIDSASGKLLVVTNNVANNGKLSLFRCNLDGTSCTHTDISAGQGTNSGMYPMGVIDSIAGKLLVVARNEANNSKPSLYRCNLDGTSCTHTDISAGQGTNSIALFPGVVIDPIAAKLLVVTCNGANNSKPSLFRCNLDGTSCTHTDISAGQGTSSGGRPTAIIDTSSGKLLAFTSNAANGGKPGLFRCNLDGTGCAHTDVSASQGANSGTSPSAVIDFISGKLLFATMNQFNDSKSGLFRCDPDGTNCTYTDISMGQGINSGFRPVILIEPSSGKLLVVTWNLANNGKPSLFIW
ncbi:fibronectin type III domain-containing protein, partial [Leptospira ilyithenensis]